MAQTLNQFAWQLGCHDRVTLAHSLVWHKAYVKAAPETQRQWREGFIAHYVAGRLQIPVTKCHAIVALKRSERSKTQELAVNAGSKKFSFHIARNDSKARSEPSKLRVSAAERAALVAFLDACGGDKARARKVFAHLC